MKYLRGLLSASQRTCPTPPRQKESLRTRTSGLLPGTHTAKPSSLLSRIGIANSPSTNNMCLHSSGRLPSPSTATSSSSTKQSETEWEDAATSSSRKPRSFETLNGRISRPSVWCTRNLKKVDPTPSSNKKNGDRSRSLDACRRWNMGVCPFSDGKCRYRHVCSKCKGGHPVSTCT